jgi:hypothetical protein
MKDLFIIQTQPRKTISSRDYAANFWTNFHSSTDLGSLIAFLCTVINNKDIKQDDFRFRVIQRMTIEGRIVERTLQITD